MTTLKKLEADLARLLSFRKDQPNTSVSPWTVLRFALHPRFLPVVLIRLSHSDLCGRVGVLSKGFALINFVLFGIEVSTKMKIGPGLVLPHTVGTVLGAKEIGSSVTIYHQVTIGAKIMDIDCSPHLRPVIGDSVVIGSGAKILGPVSIGDFAVIGANAVVTKSVPDHVVARGVPALWEERATRPKQPSSELH